MSSHVKSLDKARDARYVSGYFNVVIFFFKDYLLQTVHDGISTFLNEFSDIFLKNGKFGVRKKFSASFRFHVPFDGLKQN